MTRDWGVCWEHKLIKCLFSRKFTFNKMGCNQCLYISVLHFIIKWLYKVTVKSGIIFHINMFLNDSLIRFIFKFKALHVIITLHDHLDPHKSCCDTVATSCCFIKLPLLSCCCFRIIVIMAIVHGAYTPSSH